MKQVLKDKRRVSLLNKALARAKRSNPRLSIRAIARISGLSSSYLSKVFKGERVPKNESLIKICDALQMDHHETQALVYGNDAHKTKETPVIDNFLDLSRREYWIMERWYYFAILALASTTDGFRTAEEASVRLGLNLSVAMGAIKYLQADGFLARDKDHIFRLTSMRIRFPTARSHASVRRHQREMVERGLSKLNQNSKPTDYENRLISGVTVAGNPEYLREAKVAIEEGIYKAAEILAKGKSTEVFQLNIQLYKHTKS